MLALYASCMSPWIRNTLLSVTEAGYALLPRRRPSAAALAAIRIVSHRGERDNRKVFENTFAAFDPLLDSGVWGIEFDLRWSRDDEPVVCHDAGLRRVFGVDRRIADSDYSTLRARCPELPHLGDLVARYGQRLHLMMEIKAEPEVHPDRRRARLQKHLDGLAPGEDLHLLALDTALFERVPVLPRSCWLPVANTNCAAMSDYALSHGCAGVAAHYALLKRQQIARHRAQGQCVATGFPSHRKLLYREAGRGVDWLFSNRALRLQRLLEDSC